jgi:CDP-diacylglycerol--glycerol-3-phosphate 3-phosphatidyltransferase
MNIDKNLPNYLTVARIIVIPIIVMTFYIDHPYAYCIGAVLFILASITDFFDGYIARRFGLVSSFGRMFDPIADKLLVGSVIVMLLKKDTVNEVPCLLILSREFLVSGLREFLALVKVSIPVSRVAKVKTFLQMFALALLILGSRGSGITYLDLIGEIILWVAAFLTIITGYSYFKACSKYF